MKKFGKLMLGALLVVGTTACNDDMLSNQQDDLAVNLEGKNIVTAHVPGAGSRVEFDASGSNIQVKWKESGEEFSLYTNNPDFDDTKPAQGPDNFRYKNYTYTQVSGNKFAGNATLVVGNTIFAYYPCVGEYWNFMNAVPFQLGGQTGELDSNLTYMYISKVDVDNVDVLQFEHLTSIMKAAFKFNGNDVTNTIKRLRIFLPDGAYTDNYVDLTVNPIVYTYSGGSNEINITTEKALDQFYIYLPFGIEEGEEVSFMAYDEDTFYEGSLTAAMDIQTGKIYPTDVELTAQGTYLWTPETAASTNVGGSGSSADPFLIKTANDLQWMINDAATNVGNHYKLEYDLEIQTSDANPWSPIGNSTTPFNGVFDGNFKAINGTLKAGSVTSVNAKSLPDGACAFGFFGYIGTNGEVNNLFVNAEVKGGFAGETYTGAVVGYNEGKVSGSRSNKSVIGGDIDTSAEFIRPSYTGGVVGYNEGTIENCTGSGIVKGSENSYTYGYVGGVVGYNNGSVTSCSAYGTITAAQATEYTYMGGIAGFNNDTYSISNCTNYADLVGVQCQNLLMGGITAENEGVLTNCANNRNISSPESGDIETCYMGGIAGKNYSIPSLPNGIVSNCNNWQSVKGGKAGKIYVGGLVGKNYDEGTVENSECYGEVIGGTGVSLSYTGGLVGLNNSTISQCKVRNNVIGGTADKTYTGGFVGYNNDKGVLMDVLTQMGCIVTAGTGATTNYTGILVGYNIGKVWECCYSGSEQQPSDEMYFIGNNLDFNPSTMDCLCPLHNPNNQ